MTDTFVTFYLVLLRRCQSSLACLGSQLMHAVTVTLAKIELEKIPGNLGRQILDLGLDEAAENGSIAIHRRYWRTHEHLHETDRTRLRIRFGPRGCQCGGK